MYSYIIGSIKETAKNFVVLENNGIGYKIFVSNPFNFKLEDTNKFYLYNHIREDEHSLYGFISKEEYELFINLISVKGLGPKVALPFFALDDINSLLCAINNEDITYLKKIPKVGDKLAKQIILDLKDNIKIDNFSDDYIGKNENEEDVILALESLGYKKVDIKKIMLNIDKKLSVSMQIKEALKQLMK